MTPSVFRSSFLGITFVLMTSIGCASRPAATAPTAASPGELAPTDGPINAGHVTLIVHGMSCPLCASNVDKQLLEVPGVSDASVDMGTGQVKVTFGPKARVTRKQLEGAVYKSGFTLAEVRLP